MRDFSVFFVILVIATILYIYLEKRSLDVVYVKSDSGSVFMVRKCPDQKEAANLLCKICDNIDTLIDHLKTTQLTSKYKNIINNLNNNFNRVNIYENTGHQEKSTSYSINKGEKIIFCIRQKVTNELLDINTMMFVVIHECAHLASESIGHTKEFWDNMVYLLKQGENCGVYKYINYSKSPKEYCGMTINDTPWHKNK
jgi:hypothetical protein